MDWWDGLVSLLSCTVPKLIPYLEIIHFSVIKTKIVSHCQYGVLQERIPDQSLDQRCLARSTRPHKTYLNILVNFFCILLQNLHQWVVYRVVFVRNDKAITNTTFCHFFKAIKTNCMSTCDDCGFSGLGIVSKEAAYTLHESFWIR